jgi:hypothetical protein
VKRAGIWAGWSHYVLRGVVSLFRFTYEEILCLVGIVVALALAAVWPEHQAAPAKESAE